MRIRELLSNAAAFASTETKSEKDGNHPASHYLYHPDLNKPSTWKLLFKDTKGNDDKGHMGGAFAALTVGYRGQEVDIPEGEKKKILAHLTNLYHKHGWKTPEEEKTGGKKS